MGDKYLNPTVGSETNVETTLLLRLIPSEDHLI